MRHQRLAQRHAEIAPRAGKYKIELARLRMEFKARKWWIERLVVQDRHGVAFLAGININQHFGENGSGSVRRRLVCHRLCAAAPLIIRLA